MAQNTAEDPQAVDEAADAVADFSEDAPQHRGKAVGDFVRDHPALVLAGGVAIGMLVSALIPKGTSRKIARRATGLAEAATAASVLLGKRVRDTAEATGSDLREHSGELAGRLEKLGGSAADRLGHLGSDAAARVEKLVTPVEDAALRAGRSVVRKASEIKARVRG